MSIIIAILVAVLPPCATEDGTNCTWDASVQGNGAGTSFIDVSGTAITWEK